MRNGTPFTPVSEIPAHAIPDTPPENPENLDWAVSEIPQSRCCENDTEIQLLLEINSQLRLDRIARSRDRACLGKASAASNLQLVCIDGEIVSSPYELSASDEAYLAVVAALRGWIGRMHASANPVIRIAASNELPQRDCVNLIARREIKAEVGPQWEKVKETLLADGALGAPMPAKRLPMQDMPITTSHSEAAA
jgi:hypothetical protein